MDITDAEVLEERRRYLLQNPLDMESLLAFCLNGERYFLERVNETLDAVLAARPPETQPRIYELRLIAYIRERAARARRGLSQSNARDVSDIPFQFADRELAELQNALVRKLKERPGSFSLGALLGDTLAARGMIPLADAVFRSLAPVAKRHLACVTSFDPEFHALLGDVAQRVTAAGLPPVRSIRAFAEPPRKIIFVSADYGYFQNFGPMLLASFASHPPAGVGLALHVMDMKPEEEAAVLGQLSSQSFAWSLSSERTEDHMPRVNGRRDSKGYYHTIRFLRFWQILSQHPDAAGWLVDMDTLWNGPPPALFDVLEAADAALLMMPTRLEIRNKVAAGLVGISATPAGRDFLQRVAGYIAAYFEKGMLPWGIDQIALYTVLVTTLNAHPSFRCAAVPERIWNGTCGADVAVWAASCDQASPDYGVFRERTKGWESAARAVG